MRQKLVSAKIGLRWYLIGLRWCLDWYAYAEIMHRFYWYVGVKFVLDVVDIVVDIVVGVHVVVLDPRNLPLKFGQNRVTNSWDIADIEFLVGGGWSWWWRRMVVAVKPNFCFDRLSWVGGLTNYSSPIFFFPVQISGDYPLYFFSL